MEVENVSSSTVTSTTHKEEVGVEDDVPLPGFRFHPTDEELVGFYLRRKVEKRPIKLELIKQADIYKYDPWDLPKSSPVGEKEWYFFCKRGRKYRNSIRPNRVTGSGFWKATGIDRPIYSPSSSSGLEGRDHCIGLKKSLVYYRGSAGKGTKTDWMMHEFRQPGSQDNSSTKPMDAKSIAQEAEVWTLCRIFKRNISYKRCIPDWRELAAKKTSINSSAVDASSKTCSTDSSDHRKMAGQSSYNISFDAPLFRQQHETKPYISSAHFGTAASNQQCAPGLLISPSSVISQAPSSLFSSTVCSDINELLRHADWEDLRSLADSATANPFYS